MICNDRTVIIYYRDMPQMLHVWVCIDLYFRATFGVLVLINGTSGAFGKSCDHLGIPSSNATLVILNNDHCSQRASYDDAKTLKKSVVN